MAGTVPLAVGEGNNAEIPNDDKDACGLLMGFFDTVRKQRSTNDLLGKRKHEEEEVTTARRTPGAWPKTRKTLIPSMGRQGSRQHGKGERSGSASDETTDDESESTCSGTGSVSRADHEAKPIRKSVV